MNSLTFHRRNLPHYYQPNSTYFITFRIKDSIPLDKLLLINNKYEDIRLKNITDSGKINQNYFIEYDDLLHNCNLQLYLHNTNLAEIVKHEIHKNDNKDYKLICYSIMPNHVHLVFHLLENSKGISTIMHSIKRVSAYRINKYLGKNGNFWQSESYDHIVRDNDELNKIIEYTLMNPVKAGIVDDWKDFKHCYLADNM